MLCYSFENCVRCNLIIEHHGGPTSGLSLGADNGTFHQFAALFQKLKQHFEFALIRNGVQQEIIQHKQIQLHVVPHLPLIFLEAKDLQCCHFLCKSVAMKVSSPVVVASLDGQCLSQIGLSAVRRSQDADIQTIIHEVQGRQRCGNVRREIFTFSGVNAVTDFTGTAHQAGLLQPVGKASRCLGLIQTK